MATDVMQKHFQSGCKVWGRVRVKRMDKAEQRTNG